MSQSKLQTSSPAQRGPAQPKLKLQRVVVGQSCLPGERIVHKRRCFAVDTVCVGVYTGPAEACHIERQHRQLLAGCGRHAGSSIAVFVCSLTTVFTRPTTGARVLVCACKLTRFLATHCSCILTSSTFTICLSCHHGAP